MSSPKVTVLTAVRNGERYIPETIACIQAQTFADWEYVIVDDASEDDTVKVVEAEQRKDARLKLVHRAKSNGPYAAANYGMQSARGDYIARIDADDLCPPHRIQRQLAFLATHPQYRACVSYWQALNDRGLIPNTVTTIPGNPRVFRWALLLRGPSIHSTAFFERSAINELGGYRELALSQDYRLWCELTRRGWLGTIPEVLCYVRYHAKRQSSVSTGLQAELALDVLSDHVFALIGKRWRKEDLCALFSVGASLRMPIEKGIEMLDRWDQLWKADPDLTLQDRAELARMSALRRWKHLRANARSQPVHAFTGLLKLATTKAISISA